MCAWRLIRCAIVVSGTKSASAISRVLSPPTARSVRATCDAGEGSGWQHQNSNSNVSSPCSVTPGTGARAVVSSRRRRAASLRRASTSRRVATVVSHLRWSRGGWSGQTRSASTVVLYGVLGRGEVLPASNQLGQHLGGK